MLEIDFETVEEINLGETKMRLVQNVSTKRRYIQLWSGLSKTWNIMYRYKAEANWIEWKKRADIYPKKRKNKRSK